jgi:hypothetical protein
VEGFASVTSVAVDQSEKRVYVLDRKADALYKFDFAGNPVDFGGSNPDVSGNKLSGLSLTDISPGGRQVAVNATTHTIYLPGKDDPEEYGGTVLQAFNANGDPVAFTAGPGAGTNEIPGFHGLQGLAVDIVGNVYVVENGDSQAEGRFSIYRPSGAVLIPDPGVGVTGGRNAAVDANGTLYIQRGLFGGTGRYVPSEYPVTPDTTYSLQGAVAAKPAWSLAVDPTFNQLLVAEEFDEAGKTIARVSVFDQAGTLEGSFGEGELGKPFGIAAGTEGEVTKAFVANNPEGGPAEVRIFNEVLEPEAPEIESISANTVTGDSAKLRAKINPHNVETTYVFEYGPEDCAVALEPCTQVPIDGAAIGKGRKGVVVEQALVGLEAQSVYHYRVVATNAKGTKASPDKAFTTQGSGLGFGLGDGRAWEMVSPSNKFGGTLFASEQVVIQASESGDRLAYASRGSIVGEPAGGRLPEPATVLSNRLESGEWLTRDLTPPHTLATQLQPHTEFNLFSPDLQRAEMEPVDATPLSGEATEQTPYIWSDGTSPFFTPLLTAANVPAGEFGKGPGEFKNPVRIEGATPDLERLVIRSEKAALSEGATSPGIYLWEDGALEPINKLPGGGVVSNAALGSAWGSVRHAISEDGSRVFWTPSIEYDAAGINLPALYLWSREAGTSVRLDIKQAGASGTGAQRPAFNAASADGRVAFFTDSQRLTKDASPAGRDLYRCEVGPVEGGLGCATLTDISAPIKGSGESAEVLDQAPAVSEDGTRLYFVARGVLDPESNDQGDTAQKGSPNLYLFEEGAGVRFVAGLVEEDFLVWGGVPTIVNKLGFAVRISAAASPSGRFFTFTSEEALTGNDNESPSGERNTQAYLFDAEAGGGQLSCISCNPTGGSAVGETLPGSAAQFFPPDPGGLWAGRRVAATLPQATHTEVETGRSLYRPRSVLDNGRAFFNSVDPLVAADSNGNWDVYQYQPIGVGSCAAQTNSAAAVRSGPGCVSLISSGTAEGDAGFLDATPSGNDVFFLTKGRLSVLDTDKDLDAYDARVNGIEAVLHPPRECVGEACQPSVPPPNDPTPSSESFRGAETPLTCRKGQRKVTRNGKKVCVPTKKQKKNKHKKKAGKSGRAQR